MRAGVLQSIAIVSLVLVALAALGQGAPEQQFQAGDANQTKPAGFPPERIRQGAEIFARNCAPCHGAHMADPKGAFDLRTFPCGQHERFVHSVTKGKNSMPPWGDLLKPEQIEALWAYVMAGEKREPPCQPENKNSNATPEPGAAK